MPNLYEAVAKALRIFREEPWSQDAACQTGYVEVEIQRPITSQKVLLRKFDEWLTARRRQPQGNDPAARVKDLLK
jgi:hypothetical protein